MVDPHSEAALLNALCTCEATLEEVDLKYSLSLAELETAADAAATARERQLESAVVVEVRRDPVQSDWTAARLKLRRTLAAAAPSTDAEMVLLEYKTMSVSSVEPALATLRVPEATMSNAPPAPRSCAVATSNEVSIVWPAGIT